MPRETRPDALEHRAAVDAGVGHHQLFDTHRLARVLVRDPEHCPGRCAAPSPAAARRAAADTSRMSSASSANLPRIMSASGRTLRALMRAKRCVEALNCHGYTDDGFAFSTGRLLLAALAAVPAEGSRGGELAQLVPDHVLGHKHLHVQFAVVHHERMAHKLRHDRAGAGPGLDRLLAPICWAALHLPYSFGSTNGPFLLERLMVVRRMSLPHS
jgi:hypothetical protein